MVMVRSEGGEKEKRERERASEGGVERREWISVGLGVSVGRERERVVVTVRSTAQPKSGCHTWHQIPEE